MEKFIINGGKKLNGSIEIRGAKNAALKAFAAALLTTRPVLLKNVPEVEDIKRMVELIQSLGVKIEHIKNGEYRVTAKKIETYLLDPAIAKKLRASVVLTAPLLARVGRVKFPHPGGCVIGERPIDVFIDGYGALGAKITHNGALYEISTQKLRGSKFIFPNISVTGTEAMMMTASMAEGETFLKNCACEPEVESLANFLNSCGAQIIGAGTPNVKIRGVKSLRGGIYETIPDRIEAGSLAILAAATKSRLKIMKCEPEHLDSLWSLFGKARIKVKINKSSVEILPSFSSSSVSVKTREYPGFPTDLQAPLCVLLTQTEGHALVHETIYEGRLNWTDELKRMGANILALDPHRIEIKGPAKLKGREIESPDLRAGMAYIIAALCAKGQSTINNIYQIDRGYEKIEERLKKIGADIQRV
ncbi:MAG: UDP-N-acetylglucosamine 1-carboxyvinyltransferase [Candidatus Yanofskybacteria bacterium]|nr:UDP-N-acetylglucosamine 1-carboxyvinyltransferase [Candidatus Yanofskybacteria bacterium]